MIRISDIDITIKRLIGVIVGALLDSPSSYPCVRYRHGTLEGAASLVSDAKDFDLLNIGGLVATTGSYDGPAHYLLLVVEENMSHSEDDTWTALCLSG